MDSQTNDHSQTVDDNTKVSSVDDSSGIPSDEKGPHLPILTETADHELILDPSQINHIEPVTAAVEIISSSESKTDEVLSPTDEPISFASVAAATGEDIVAADQAEFSGDSSDEIRPTFLPPDNSSNYSASGELSVSSQTNLINPVIEPEVSKITQITLPTGL